MTQRNCFSFNIYFKLTASNEQILQELRELKGIVLQIVKKQEDLEKAIKDVKQDSQNAKFEFSKVDTCSKCSHSNPRFNKHSLNNAQLNVSSQIVLALK